MRVLIQRVTNASVKVEGQIRGEIGHGLLLLVGIGEGDDESKLSPMAEKICNLRIFADERGKFHHSLSEVSGEVLLIPQFTLFADTSRGRRPEFTKAMRPEPASELFNAFAKQFSRIGIKRVETGVFGADMKVALLNDGPVTIYLDE